MTEEEKGQEKQKESVTPGVLTGVKSQEVKLLVSSPRPVSGKSLRGNIQDFESLSETIRFTRVCGLASFLHRYQLVCASYLDLTRTTVLGSIRVCRICTLSRVNPHSRAFAAIPGGTIIGPVIEVQIVKILDQYGLEIAIPSPNDRQRTSHVMVSSGSPYSQCRTQIQCRITH